MGLCFLSPPIFAGAFCIGYLLTSTDSFGAALLGYIISISAASIIAVNIARRTTFEINPNAVSYHLNFVWASKKEVILANVTEVALKVGPLQKIFGLGTVVLHNLASTNNTSSGFSLSNIENPDMVYEYLKDAISKTTAV